MQSRGNRNRHFLPRTILDFDRAARPGRERDPRRAEGIRTEDLAPYRLRAAARLRRLIVRLTPAIAGTPIALTDASR
jgi:hypothetical protein